MKKLIAWTAVLIGLAYAGATSRTAQASPWMVRWDGTNMFWKGPGATNYTIMTPGGLTNDAPSDGSEYARKDGDWVVVTGGGGAATNASLLVYSGTNLVGNVILDTGDFGWDGTNLTVLGIDVVGNLAHLTTNQATANGWGWSSDGTNITITAYDHTKGGVHVTIPDTIGGLPVSALAAGSNPTGDGAFDGNASLTYIGGGGNLTALPLAVFFQCAGVTRVDLPTIATVGEAAFAFMGELTRVDLLGATAIGDEAFSDSAKLNAVYYGAVVPSVGTTVYFGTVVTNYYPAGSVDWLALDPQELGGQPAVMVDTHATTLSSVALGRKTLDEIFALTNGLLDEAAADLLYLSITNNLLQASTITNMLDAKVDVTDGVSTNQTFAGTNFWSSGRVHYLPVNADINAYIASAAVVNGDTIQLASGTYTLTGYLTIGKSVHLRGQGRGKTTLSRNGDNGDTRATIEPTVSNVMLSDMTVTHTGSTTTQFSIGRNVANANLTGIRIERVDFTLSGAGFLVGFMFNMWDAVVVDCTMTVTSSGSSATGMLTGSVAGGTAARTVDIYRTAMRVNSFSVSTTASRGFSILTSSAPAYTNTVNIHDCKVYAYDGSTGQGSGVNAGSDGLIFNVYGGVFDGETHDLRQTASRINVHGPVTLANGTTSGTITYAGTTAANRAHIEGPVRLANTTKPTAATGFGWIYAKTNEVYVLDGTGNETLISTNLLPLIEAKEDALGNPLVDDYVLSSKVDGTRSWVENAGGGSGWLIPLSTNYVVKVGPLETYTKMTDAISYLSQTFQPVYPGTATVQLQNNYTNNGDQVIVEGVDLSWITINHVGGVTVTNMVVRSALTNEMVTGIFPLFGANNGGTLPNIGALFKMDTSGTLTGRDGVMANNQSAATILANAGVQSAYFAVFARNSSKISAANSRGEGAVLGVYALNSSVVNAESIIITGYTVIGIYANNQSTINCKGASAVGTGASTGIWAEGASLINAENAVATGCTTYGIYSYKASIVNAHGANVSGAGSIGIFCYAGSIVNAESANASGATNKGIYAQRMSTVNAYGANARKGGVDSVTDFEVLQGSFITKTAGTGGVSQTVNTLTAAGIIFN